MTALKGPAIFLAQFLGDEPTAAILDYLIIDEGVRGMAFIDNVMAAAQSKKSG